MNIYHREGKARDYLDFKKLLGFGMPFIIIIGGRGTGKTYGALEYAIEERQKFILMRRMQAQLDIINKPEFSPFKKLNVDKGWNIGNKSLTKYNSGYYHMEIVDEKEQAVGELLGTSCALTTISNMRGFDASDMDLLIYDEFVAEKHARAIKNEASAFFNAVETINRNRELEGKKPIQTLMLSNSDDLVNPIFLELRLVKKALSMTEKGQEVFIDRERGLLLVVLSESKISEKKADTALYRLTAGTGYSEMALDNKFSNEEIGRIDSKVLKEYKPIVSAGEITVYRHKAKKEYYVSMHKTGVCPVYGTGDIEKKRFQRVYQWLWGEYMKNNIVFEEYLAETLLTKMYD